MSIAQTLESQGCPLPVTVTGLAITLYEPTTATFVGLRRDFPVTYSLVR